MLYPRGICLFPPLPPIPSFHEASLFTRRQCVCVCVCGGGGGGGGVGGGKVGEEEERSLALLASLVEFLPLFPTKKTWSQASD